MNLILKWIIYALIIMLIAFIVPGITVANFLAALLAVVVMALVNIFVRPLAEFISLPINILTLGLFGFVVNGLLFLLVGYLSPGLYINGFWSGLLGALLLTIFSSLLENYSQKK